MMKNYGVSSYLSVDCWGREVEVVHVPLMWTKKLIDSSCDIVAMVILLAH